jgi:hypothetical protein
MTAIPVLFSGPMVPPLIKEAEHPGTGKSMTRRLALDKSGKPSRWQKVKPGFLLWVKETHWRYGYWSKLNGRWRWVPIVAAPPCLLLDEPPDLFKASKRAESGWHKWPSIYLPRESSRLTLEVTATKREPLQKISREDAIAEGATSKPALTGYKGLDDGWSMNWQTPYKAHALGGPREAFGAYINELHGGKNWNLKPSNLWAENPEVVAISFKVHRCNVDQVEP